jgi:HAD superfamily hydrolase (TIGR01509 family)
VGVKKPDARIYRRAMEWASVRPEEILFIDDLEKNVHAAIALGMQGIQFVSAAQMREELSLTMG